MCICLVLEINPSVTCIKMTYRLIVGLRKQVSGDNCCSLPLAWSAQTSIPICCHTRLASSSDRNILVSHVPLGIPKKVSSKEDTCIGPSLQFRQGTGTDDMLAARRRQDRSCRHKAASSATRGIGDNTQYVGLLR